MSYKHKNETRMPRCLVFEFSFPACRVLLFARPPFADQWLQPTMSQRGGGLLAYFEFQMKENNCPTIINVITTFESREVISDPKPAL